MYLWAFGHTLCKLAGNIPQDEVNIHHFIPRPTFTLTDLINYIPVYVAVVCAGSKPNHRGLQLLAKVSSVIQKFKAKLKFNGEGS